MKEILFILFFVPLLGFMDNSGNIPPTREKSNNLNIYETHHLAANTTNSNLGQLRMSLYESGALANNEAAADGLVILFNTNGNNGVDANDAPDIANLDENFSTNNNGVFLSIESRAAPADQEEIQLEVNTYRDTNYTIVAEGIAIQNAVAFLHDSFTNTNTEIPQNGEINYAYTVDAGNSQSIANDRFKIIFEVETLALVSDDLKAVSIYPNPSIDGHFYAEIPNNITHGNFIISDMLGKEVLKSKFVNDGEVLLINPEKLVSTGNYVLELHAQDQIKTFKLIVQ